MQRGFGRQIGFTGQRDFAVKWAQVKVTLQVKGAFYKDKLFLDKGVQKPRLQRKGASSNFCDATTHVTYHHLSICKQKHILHTKNN